MKKTILHYHYSRLLALFHKLQSRLNKNFLTGRFKELSKRQQYRLVKRLEKIKAQLSRMESSLKYGTMALTAATGLSLLSANANAQLTVAGTEFQVNTFTTGTQQYAKVAMDSDGDFVITWASRGQDDGVEYGIDAQCYNAQGVATSAEFRVNTYTVGRQTSPAIAMEDNGDFVIVWTSNGQDGNSGGVYGQRFKASGQAVGSEFLINTTTTGNQYSPAVAMDSDGDFVVTWSGPGNSYDIYARRYDANGDAVSGEFRVNTNEGGIQRFSAIAMDNDGDFVITWSDAAQDGSSYGIYGRRYNNAGVPQGNEFKVNTYTTSQQKLSTVAMDGDGDFVVAWASSGQDESLYGIYAQRYNANGVAQGAEFRVNTYTTGTQTSPAIAMDDQSFVIAWQSTNQDGNGIGIYAQRFNAAGTAQDTEFKVNTYTTGDQSQAAIGMDNDGDFVIAWASPQDGSANGVYAQRYDVNLAPTALTLSNASFNENTLPLSVIGEFSTVDPDNNNTFTYSLVSGAGSTDNDAFTIVGKELWLNSLANFETKNSYSIRVRSTDNGGLYFEKVITLTVLDVNDVPNNITLSANSVAENAAADTEIGTFTTTDEDASNTFTYSLVAGTGDTDNASFAIVGDKLQIKVSPDYEMKDSYSIRVRTTDQGGLTFEELFLITVTDVNEAPSDITISVSSIDEGIAANSEIAVLSATDQDGAGEFTFALVSGTGDDDNDLFEIDGDKLTIKESPDFDTKSSYSIRVSATDADGLSVEKTLVITVNEVTGINNANAFSASIKLYPNPAKGMVQVNLEGTVVVRILDLSGHLVKETTTDNHIVAIDGMPAGVYMLEFIQNDKTGFKKLVIE